MRIKSVPDINLSSFRPPFDSWNYFEDGDRNTLSIINGKNDFKYNSGNFEMINAWWLIELATLAYSKPKIIENNLSKCGIKEFRFFSHTFAKCYVISTNNFIIVVFRGTELSGDFNNISKNIITDISIIPSLFGQGSLVHSGFKNSLNGIWQEVKEYLATLNPDLLKPVWFTGHSLGAALATLAAYKYKTVTGLYTYGSPRVGDFLFKRNFSVPTFRFVNNDDIICNLPLGGIYQHVGRLKFIDSSHNVCDNPSRLERLGNNLCVGFQHLVGKDGIRDAFMHLIPSSFISHSPLLYSVYIWNNYIKSNRYSFIK